MTRADIFSDGPDNEDAASFHIDRIPMRAGPLEPGLYLVATPIGHLKDITLRALETIASADCLACEDTRVTRRLLDRYGIARKPFVYHEHNAEKAGAVLLEMLAEGRSVALVSDAGTPLISDPGYRLVGQARAAGHRVFPIPGASAPLAALVASGLPTDSFLFGGFLPARATARKKRLAELDGCAMTMVFFESPNRLQACLQDMAEILSAERRVSLCRELTKLHETVMTDRLEALIAHFSASGNPKGEIVLVVEPAKAQEAYSEKDIDDLLRQLAATMPPSRAAAEAARRTGRPRKELYDRLLKDQGTPDD